MPEKEMRSEHDLRVDGILEDKTNQTSKQTNKPKTEEGHTRHQHRHRTLKHMARTC